MFVLRPLSIVVVAIAAVFLLVSAARKPEIEIDGLQFLRSAAADADNHIYDYVFTAKTDRELDSATFDILFYNDMGDYLGKGMEVLEMINGTLKVCGTTSLSGIANYCEVVIGDVKAARVPLYWPYVTITSVQMTRNAASDASHHYYDYLFTANITHQSDVTFSILFYDSSRNFLGYAKEYQELSQGANKIGGGAEIAGQASMIEVLVTGAD